MTFEWPLLLWSLATIPLLLSLYLLAQRRRRAYAVRFTNLQLLRTVAGRTPGLRRHVPPLLFLLGLSALLVSLARPVAVIAVPRDQTGVMLVLDVSGSMEANDLRPNRMAAAQAAAQAFVDEIPSNVQLGLVSFSSGVYLNAPLSPDRAQVTQQIDRLRPGGGTAIGDGLHLALDQLAERPLDETGQRAPGLVVLLSDGQSTAGRPPADAAARAREENVPVYTIGVGQRDGPPVMVQGQPVQLDETTLQTIADTTGGHYFYAAETGDLQQIYTDLGSQISLVEERTEVTAIASAIGALLLTIAGLLSLRWFGQLP
jgi:Ca-activated chloride channel homolog